VPVELGLRRLQAYLEYLFRRPERGRFQQVLRKLLSMALAVVAEVVGHLLLAVTVAVVAVADLLGFQLL
jgi:hypothetical protein